MLSIDAKVVILCGGFGTRIRGTVENLPKPLIPIGDRPILWHIMRHYHFYGMRKFVLCLGYKSEQIQDYFINYHSRMSDLCVNTINGELTSLNQYQIEDWEVLLANTGSQSMTGSRVHQIQKYVSGDDNFFLTYGDGVSDINLHELFKFHIESGRILTISGVRPPGRFGELQIEADRVVAFNEKPQVSEGRISGGFFVCSKDIFNYLSGEEGEILEKDPFQKLVEDGQVSIFRHDGFWQPMDTGRDFDYLNNLYDIGKQPWTI